MYFDNSAAFTYHDFSSECQTSEINEQLSALFLFKFFPASFLHFLFKHLIKPNFNNQIIKNIF